MSEFKDFMIDDLMILKENITKRLERYTDFYNHYKYLLKEVKKEIKTRKELK
jgi:hypothetical protein